VRTGIANINKSSNPLGRNTSEMAVKSHVKHRVVDKYFDYKVAEIEKKE